MENFEPVIVAFCCHYCAYTAADMAGSQRLPYPPNVKIVQVPCSGKVDSLHIVKAFEKGADGVYVAGCLDGDCNFKKGNERAAKRIDYVKKYLEEIGLESERLEMVNMSAGMGHRFAQVATEITEKIRNLGPNPVKTAIAQ
jgi:F420-non-reducing hydrogenase iron-sulfur subunit